uniref:Uncharacterized protein n=1 Tax=Anguilla anguilla TaxID=7936 RepID=A0A0E9XU42_ANGAN
MKLYDMIDVFDIFSAWRTGSVSRTSLKRPHIIWSVSHKVISLI